jgi:multidrug efflux system membrane fusion protein
MSIFRKLTVNNPVKPHLYVITLIVIISAWMASGQRSLAVETDRFLETESASLTHVRTKTIKSELVTRNLTLYGRTEPDHTATVTAEVSGQIIEILAERGSVLKKGDLIARIDKNDLPLQLAYAQIRLKQRKVEFDGIKKLSIKGFQGNVQLAESESALKQAQAELGKLQSLLKKKDIRAPQSGILNERFIEEGEFVSIGTDIAQITDIDPLIVSADVAERDINLIKLGQSANIRLLDDRLVEGELRYISRVSNSETNTFKIEVSIPNADGRLWAGVSAELSLPLQETRAIKVSPSLMALDEQGNIGIKTVHNNVVSFHLANLVKTDQDGAWLGGFDEEVEVIILGQGFVKRGDLVETTRMEN